MDREELLKYLTPQQVENYEREQRALRPDGNPDRTIVPRAAEEYDDIVAKRRLRGDRSSA